MLYYSPSSPSGSPNLTKRAKRPSPCRLARSHHITSNIKYVTVRIGFLSSFARIQWTVAGTCAASSPSNRRDARWASWKVGYGSTAVSRRSPRTEPSRYALQVFNFFKLQSVLSCLSGHVTRFLMPYGTGEIDCLDRLNVIQIRSAVQWHSLFAYFFPFWYDMPETFWQSKSEEIYCTKNSTDYSG